MQRLLSSGLPKLGRTCYSIANNVNSQVSLRVDTNRCFSYFPHNFSHFPQTSSLLSNSEITKISNNIPSRSVCKFSLKKGKRKSVKAVVLRFYRLHWGGWIRTIAGRHKRLWKKSAKRKRRLRQHVFCNATQSTLLDKMVGPYWRKPRYYVDDPYEPYHTREEFGYTYVKPKPYIPPE